jgi:hypothetical protein
MFGHSQDRPLRKKPIIQTIDGTPLRGDTINRGDFGKKKRAIKNKNATIDLYKIISHENDTTYLDTTLTIQKEYKFNYLRKDEFDLLSFSNIGQTYTTLSHDFKDISLMPKFASQGRHFNFRRLEDVNYFNVPTPLTELMYKTAFQQGQLLESFFTVNTSRRFNFSIGYKGLRSIGKYQHILTSTGNFEFTTNYRTENNRYHIRGHVVMQDVMQEENGGLLDEDLEKFESGNPNFIDRSVFDPLFENAFGEIREKRFHIEHYYNLVQKKDSVSSNFLRIGNRITFVDKFYKYVQTSANGVFGDAFSNDIEDRSELEDFYAEANVEFVNNDLGRLKTHVAYRDFNYGYDALVSINGVDITNRLKGNVISVGAEYENRIGKFFIRGKAGLNVSGNFDGNFIDAKASFKIKENVEAVGGININSKAPNYNTLLYQSGYINYNWQNNFNNIQTKQLSFKLNSDKWFNAEFDYNTINNYVYFITDEEDGLVMPEQTSNTINYLRIKLNKEVKFGKFALDNTFRYQKVLDGEGLLNVPEYITRNTLYYSNHFFNKALYLQTGVSFNYFAEYYMDAYDPVLGEFYVQNQTEIGGFPRLDFFINAKVRQTRIYLKAEHFNSSFTGYNYYSAPNYPYRDFVVRFGLVWNFFL